MVPVTDRSSSTAHSSTLTPDAAPSNAASSTSVTVLEPSQTVTHAESMPIALPHTSPAKHRLPKLLAITAGVAAAAGLGAGLALRYAINTGSVPTVLQTEQTFPPQPGWLQPETPLASPVPVTPVPPIVYEAPVPTAPERQTTPIAPSPDASPAPLPTLPSPAVYPTSDPLSPTPEPVTAPSPAPIATPDASQPVQPDSSVPVSPSPDLAPTPASTLAP